MACTMGRSNGAKYSNQNNKSLKGPPSGCFQAVYSIWRWAAVVLVLALMLSLVGTGIICLLPRICSTWATVLAKPPCSLHADSAGAGEIPQRQS